jgi:hypothetical protein
MEKSVKGFFVGYNSKIIKIHKENLVLDILLFILEIEKMND